MSGEAANVQQGELRLTAALPLHFGGELNPVQIAWRMEGAAGKPVVLVLGGISAGRQVVANYYANQSQGWWKEVMGPERPLDTRHYRVLGIDFLGGSGQSTGPRAGQTDFPSISAYDQVAAIAQLLSHLQVAQLYAVIGASYGGMVALALGERAPQLAQRLIVISAAHRTHPMATAWRCVQRNMVRYAATRGEGAEGLKLARALAMATYRTPEEFVQRFAGEPERGAQGFVFPVEKYLFSRGDTYAASYVPESFVCLSESIDLHRVNAAAIRLPTTLVAIIEDQLVPLSDMRELHAQLAGPKQLIELPSLYGHDAFLKETEALRRVFAAALA
ncbi:homoserine O-succinyltransferase MetX [Arenimonas sp.]|uniref:homoserine O-succinyltransferase MetX n=1 Tax=Arenimonas sp. TaxID=1872635 RepID=UPI0039E47E86